MVNIDTRGLNRLMRRELPTAMRNAINDIARDVVQRERKEIERVFDEPKPFTIRSVRLIDRATKTEPVATIGIPSASAARTLRPHIPGYPRTREYQMMEKQLRAAGLINKGQYLIPSRTAKLTRYGNISLANQNKMIRDVTTATGRGTYVWGTVRGSKGQLVTGIWNRRGFEVGRQGALQVLVVQDEPDYDKRFRFHEIGLLYANRVSERHVKLAVRYAMERRRG